MHKIGLVTAKNFFSYKDIRINFSKYKNNENILIHGKVYGNDKSDSNGAGKSVIAELLPYGIFGKTIREVDYIGDVVNSQVNKDCVVTIEFGDYFIERYRKDKKHGNELYFWKYNHLTDTDEDLRGNSNDETQKRIEEVFGINFQSFMNAHIFTGSINRFTTLSDKERKKIFETLVNVDWIETSLVKVKKEIDVTKSNLITIKSKIDSHNMVISRLNDKISRLDNEYKLMIDKNISSADNLELNIKNSTTSLSKRVEHLDILKKDKNEIEEFLVNNNDVYDKFTKANSYIIEVDVKSDNINDSICQYEDELKTLHNSESKVNTLIHEYDESIKEDINDINNELSIVANDINDTNIRLVSLKKDFDNKKHILETFESDIDTYNDDIKAVNSDIATCSYQIKSYDKSINKLKGNAGECTECLQPISDKFKNSTILKLEKQIVEVNKSLQLFNKSLRDSENKKSTILTNRDDVSNIKSEIQTTNECLLRLQLQQNNLIKEQEGATNGGLELTKKLNDIKKSIKIIQLNIEDNICANDKMLSNKKYISAKLSIAKYSSIIAKCKKLRDIRLIKINTKIEACNKDIDSCNDSIKCYKESIKSLKKIKKDLKSKCDEIKNDLDEENDQLSIINDTENKYVEILRYLDCSKFIFGKDGIKVHIFNILIPIFKQKINYYLSMIENNMFVDVSVRTELKNKTVDKFSIIPYRKGGAKNYSGLSKGQKRKVDVAIVLAMKHLYLINNKDCGITIFDELFDGLDETAAENIVNLLNKELGVKLIMTHSSSLKDNFSCILTAIMKNEISTLEEN